MKHIFEKIKIKRMQLDPFGYCNAKCWFCPVRYIPQPEEGAGNMSTDLIEKIFTEILKEKNSGVVDPNFDFIATSHYNEILLYKDFDKLLELLRKYKFKTMVLSNGISLIPQKADLIAEYSDVVTHVGLNIPAFEANVWAERSGFSSSQFDRLVSNVRYAKQKLSHLKEQFRIGINGLNHTQVLGGHITLGPKFSSLNYDLRIEHEKQYIIAQKLFPDIFIEKWGLYDRAGTISDYISNQDSLKNRNNNKKVVGCTNWGDRSTEWLNVNSAGNVFLCCNDYNFDYKFGNLGEQSLREIWLGELHTQIVEKAYKEICMKCSSAKMISI
jgi:radical SAM protein with 4Fe4S-binding SPASM domain